MTETVYKRVAYMFSVKAEHRSGWRMGSRDAFSCVKDLAKEVIELGAATSLYMLRPTPGNQVAVIEELADVINVAMHIAVVMSFRESDVNNNCFYKLRTRFKEYPELADAPE